MDGVGNESTLTRGVRVVDTQPPVITLNGDNPLTVECGTAYNEPGATAVDSCDGLVAVTVSSTVNTAAPGTYTVTYLASDNVGNEATATRTVNVVDTQPPAITLNAGSPISVECGSVFSDPGAIALDVCDGSLAVTASGTVNTAVPGTYTLTYRAVDTAGHDAVTTRTVVVVDTFPPVITLDGNNPLTLECGATYNEPGVTALDSCEGTRPVTISNTVNTLQPGTYLVTYRASDSAGNEAVATRTVNVVDTQAPVITLHGQNPITIECGGSFDDPGGVAFDACNGLQTLQITGSVNTQQPGTYTRTYVAQDASGNTATQTRTVIIVDTTPPLLTLVGPNLLTLECGSTFVDPGASAVDSCDGSIGVTTEGSVDTAVPGTYLVRYVARDRAGNVATLTRNVTVQDTTPPTLVVQDAGVKSRSVTPTLVVNAIVVPCGSTFTPPPYTVSDACDPNPTVTIDTQDLNLNVAGTYSIFYRATDSTGNVQIIERVVIVEPPCPGEGGGEGTPEGVIEGTPEGVVEGSPEGIPEGSPEGVIEGAPEGTPEGIVEGAPEGFPEGNPEGTTEGHIEGTPEGEGEVVPCVLEDVSLLSPASVLVLPPGQSYLTVRFTAAVEVDDAHDCPEGAVYVEYRVNGAVIGSSDVAANHFAVFAPLPLGMHHVEVKAYVPATGQLLTAQADVRVVQCGISVPSECTLCSGNYPQGQRDEDGDGVPFCLECIQNTLDYLIDSDGDGISDGRDITPCGQDAEDDPDEDAVPNLEEFWRLGNPEDSNSPDEVRFVAPPARGGSDANPGTREAPWATLQYAIDHVPASITRRGRVIIQRGVYTENIHLRSNVTLVSASRDPRNVEIRGQVTTDSSGRDATLAYITFRLPAGAGNDAPLVSLNNAGALLDHVNLYGPGHGIGIDAQGAGASSSVLTDSVVNDFGIGVRIEPAAVFTVRRNRFENNTLAFYIYSAVSPTVKTISLPVLRGSKLFGDATDPNTGWNTIVAPAQGLAVVNETTVSVTMENNDWNVTSPAEISSVVQGNVDVEPFLAKSSAVLVAALYATVWDARNQARITNATATLSPSPYQPVTQNQNGVYAFSAISAGGYTVTVSAPNYQTAAQTVFVNEGELKNINFALTPVSGEGEGEGEPSPPPRPRCCLRRNTNASLQTAGGDVLLTAFTIMALLGSARMFRKK